VVKICSNLLGIGYNSHHLNSVRISLLVRKRRKDFSMNSRKRLHIFRLITLLMANACLVAFAQTGDNGLTANTHNSWSQGKTMPVAVCEQATGEINGQIYNVGGETTSAVVTDNQIYDPSTNTWSTGTPMRTGIANAAYAVVNNILYLFGGTTDGQLTGTTKDVWSYNPQTDMWTLVSQLPSKARQGAVAVAADGLIYVIGGTTAEYKRLNTVDEYDPATNKWMPPDANLLKAKASPAYGLVQSTIIAASGETASGPKGDNEGYDVSTSTTWVPLLPDPHPRVATCSGVINGLLYSAGGVPADNQAFRINESYDLSTNQWASSLARLPQAAVLMGSAVYNGQLYCFGGGSSGSAVFPAQVYGNVQIYQP
jgi:N-acetylneuraminic acid mutarotase